MQRMLALPVEAREADAPAIAPTPPQLAVARPVAPSYTLDLHTAAAPVLQPQPAASVPVVKARPLAVAPAPVLQAPPAAEAPVTSRRPNPLVPMVLPQRQGQASQRSTTVASAPTLAPAPKLAPEPLPPAKPIWINPTSGKPTAPPPKPGLLGQALQPINWLYDTVTLLLGPLGGWLRSEGGRSFVGWCGIAMLLAAALWAAVVFLG
jgi:hypothetical protein